MNAYAGTLKSFEQICQDLGRFASDLMNTIDHGVSPTLELESSRLYQQFESAFNGPSRGETDCRGRLRSLFGELTTQIAALIANPLENDSDIIEDLVAAASRFAQRITADYTSATAPLPLPRKLIVGAPGLIEALREGRLKPYELNRALFWRVDLPSDMSHPAKIGMQNAALLNNATELSEQLSSTFERAYTEGRASIDEPLTGSVMLLNAMLARFDIAPVNSSDFLYDFLATEDSVEFDWTAELYGFDVV